MYSSFIKIILALLGFSPALFCLWLAKLISMRKEFRVFFRFTGWKRFEEDVCNFLSMNYLLFVFLALIFLTRFLMKFAKRRLQRHRFYAKGVKSVDYTLGTMFLSVGLPFLKIISPSASDAPYLIGFFVIGVLYGISMRNTHYLNLAMKFFLGYAHYEIQSTKEVTFMVISRKPILNRDKFTEYVELSGTFVLNVSNDA